ncbi:hypothetical protein FACS1894137_13880 [Spirochaetia bacterium]|nr:hypothetical protein FACS1894137_13880 [Spirochaetia bacterium]
MEVRKTAIILTDDAASTKELAGRLAAGMRGVTVRVLAAPNFAGNALLPGDYFFFGCARPRPSEFAYLEELLEHINLAGRPCGIFSPDSGDALRYLADLAGPSELALNSEPLLGSALDMSAPHTLQQWAADILKQ